MYPRSHFQEAGRAARWLADFVADESGVTAIEYALVGALIVVACAAAITSYASALGDLFNTWCAAVLAALGG